MNNKKIDKKYIGIGVIVLLCIAIIVVYSKITGETEIIDDYNMKIKSYYGQDYYIFENDTKEEHDIQYVDFSEDFDNRDKYKGFEVHKVFTYMEYYDYCNKWGLEINYDSIYKNYIVFSYLKTGPTSIEARLGNVEYYEDTAELYVWDAGNGVVASLIGYVIVVPTNKSVDEVDVYHMYTEQEFANIKKYGNSSGRQDYEVKKPVIYLYPTETTDIKVKLLKDNNITTSYPKYDKEWLVSADKNGNLVDLKTNKKLYALYYESKVDEEYTMKEDGFIVNKEDITSFLEEKLTILGLNDKEREEFIIYWLPILEKNNYNYIRFATRKEIDEKLPINIEPNPDTFIRIIMTYKGLEEPINIKEQQLEKVTRTGYTAVEWGGTLIK